MSAHLIYLLEVSICLSVLYTFFHFFLRELPSFQWNRIYLMGMYAVSFLLPLLHFNVYPIYIEKSLGAKNTTSFAGTVESVVADQAIDMYKGVFIIYGVIALIFACRLLINLTTVLLRIWRSSKVVGPHYTVLEGQDSDKVYSFFRYLIKPKNQNLRDEILEHELIHIRQYHSIDLIISEIAKAILWFNPFVYLIQKTIKTNHEYICDSYASKRNGRYNYAKLLSEISFGSSHLTCVNNFSYKLKNRIIMLQKLDKLIHRKWRYALILPLLLLGLHMYAFKTYRIITLPPDNEAAVDTIPYQVDTITIFDSDTYEETVRYEKFVTDTISTFDTDTYKETVTFERRVIEEGPINVDVEKISDSNVDQCYILFWNEMSLHQDRQWTVELIKESLQGEIHLASIITDNCERVKSWSARIIVVPAVKDPQVQLVSLSDNKVSENLLNDGYLIPGTKLFFENVTVNEKEVKSLSSVITIE